jgi:large subunit ribosomal protein L23
MADAEEMESRRVILYPISGDKAFRLMEFQNKLVFAVVKSASKRTVAKAVEDLYNVKVTKLNVVNTSKGVKKAYVQLAPEHSAEDIATRLGVL